MISDRLRAVAGVLVLVVAGCSGSNQPGIAVTAASGVTAHTVPTASTARPIPAISAARSGSTRPSVRTTGPPAQTTQTSQPTQPIRVAQVTADPNVAGPEHGPACAVDGQYADEAPSGLRADVLAAWLTVRKFAAAKGVTLCLNDGKRSAAQQRALFTQYVKEYGAVAAHEYVLPPEKSAHVKGYAVDVQPATANQWLQASKGRFGWCRIYGNEPWHFEYSVDYRTSGCPARMPKPVP